MALIKCPECELQISDKALSCPHCGYPMKKSTTISKGRGKAKTKQRRLPNGFGSITKLSGNRRKPFIVRVSNGLICNESEKTVKPNRVVLGYYKTKSDAISALYEYNARPYDLAKKDMTFQEIYDIVFETKIKKLSKHTQSVYNSIIKHCKPIGNMKISDIHTEELQYVIDNCGCKSGIKTHLKSLMGKIFEYALQNDLVKNDYSKYVEFETDEVEIKREIFTKEEIKLIRDNQDVYTNKILLILLYTGMRANELFQMKRENVHIEERYMFVAHAKNKMSVRNVPIHDSIFPIVVELYNRNGETLTTNDKGRKSQYKQFTNHDMKLLFEEYGFNHKLHDTRHTFITNARLCGVDNLCLKRMVGHSINGVTERVYTHIEIEELLTEINKIKM